MKAQHRTGFINSHASLYAVRCWEQGKSDSSHDTLVAICRLYGVSADYLFGLTDDDPIYSQRRQKNNLNQENLATLKRFEAFYTTNRNDKAPIISKKTTQKIRQGVSAHLSFLVLWKFETIENPSYNISSKWRKPLFHLTTIPR